MTSFQITLEPLEIKSMSGYFGGMKPILLITLGSTLIDAFLTDEAEVTFALFLLIVMLLATAGVTLAAWQLHKANVNKS